jgi:hypothetical protein
MRPPPTDVKRQDLSRLRLDRKARMTIKVIVDLTAHPGQHNELRAVLERTLAAHGSDLPGFLGSSATRRSTILMRSSRSLRGSPPTHVKPT